MRKRLIEKFTKSKEGSFGYTMTELLVVVAIIAIVAAIAIPSVIAISRALKFKRVNDHAKSIFLAAQQNLTEMRSDGGLKPLQEAGGLVLTNIVGFPEEYKTEYVYTTQGTTAFELILPAGSVDGTVRAEQIIIEYNPITGNVYSVFYSEEDESILSDYQSQDGLPRDDKDSRKKIMLGYYDGSGLNSSQLEIEEVRATVEFINGEEGIVRVLVPVPDDFFGNLDEYAKAMTINLTVTGEYSMVQAASGAAEGESGETAQTPGYMFSVPIKVAGPGLGDNCYVEYGNTIVVEYPIDSLVNYGSFANYSSTTYDGAKNAGGTDAKAHLTDLMDESRFTILPGENITLEAEVKVDTEVKVEVENGILSGVNPMFEYLQPDGSNGYVLAVSNGRNLQNLNAIAPTIAKQVSSVVFTSDIYWNDTVSYYNDKYDTKTSAPGYQNAAGENPARALPYFVPIHHEDLFGTAKFIFPGEGDGGLGGILEELKNFFDKIGEVIFGGFNNPKVPSLTDEMDAVMKNQDPNFKHAGIQGNGHKVYNLNIDSNAYTVPNADAEAGKAGKFYATGKNQIVDYYFSGLFGYVNTPIDGLHVVNPIVKGHTFDDKVTQVPVYGYKWEGWRYVYTIVRYDNVYQYNNPATGALLGVGGYDTVITNCSTYIDKDARGYVGAYLGHGDFSATTAQKWYGVSGEGAVGGLVGYAKSHRAVNGALTNNKAHLAFSGCFAAVPVSGNMRTTYDKDFGYSNGIGAFIGNSQLTNFYNCYASGDVRANGCMVRDTDLGGLSNSIAKIFGVELDLMYNGRTSWGAGGFVGSSHGTCYTNCFATGDVSATSKRAGKGAGGFVGVMSLDETSAYGNTALNSSGGYIGTDDAQIAQRTVFTNCYAVGSAVTDGNSYENFSGANGRIVYDPGESMTYFIGDYYRLYAPYYDQFKRAPVYGESFYIYRDTYYLSRNVSSAQNNSRSCAEPTAYEVLQNLTGVHTLNSAWSLAQLEEVKNIPTVGVAFIFPIITDYENAYFDENHPTLENLYKQLYAEGYSTAEWENATAATTHPYTLSAGGAVYPFTKLKGMHYYGDWPAKPSDIGVAYYEQYVGDDNTYYIFDKERGDTDTRLALKDGEDVVVKKDGYAIFSASQQDLTVTVGKVSKTLKWSGETFTIEGKKYYSFLFADELMEAGTAANEFYSAVTARHGGGTTYTMYFNPSVAISHVNPANGATLATKPDAAPKTIYVRSARQFKALATLDDFWGKDYSYIQQLNIDADQYSWDDAERKLSSIGNAQNPFQASYSAGYTVEGDIAKQYAISNFLFDKDTAGFFGVVGKDGSIENLIINCANVTVGGTSVPDVAVLAGRNEGTISNVDMTLTGTTTLNGKDNAGLLAGYSSGTVRNCEVSAAAVTVNAKNGGGLIGSVEGTANEKAKVSGCKLTLTGDLAVTGTGNAGGLIGQAKHLNLTGTEPLVSMTNTKLTADKAAYAGGLAGWMENSEVKITDAASVTTVTFNTLSAKNGVTAGFLGGGKNIAANGVDVTAGTVSGKVAAGLVGTGTNVDAEYCDVVITNSIQGETKAAGVAGTIGAQSVFNYVTVNHGSKVTATNGNAAGYAVELAAETDVMNGSVTLNNTTISASGNAAGYACTVAGDVFNSSGSSVITSVVGKGTISGANAAGFACDITGDVSGAFVTPALDSSKYLGNSNNNLVVNGTTSAAGFALNMGADATVSNCYALNTITGGTVTGFVTTNKGTISGCMANVTIDGGYAFVEKNEGTVYRCYGWYGDDKAETATVATVNGKCFGAYFADLNPADKEGKIVTLYAADGTEKIITATELQGAAEMLAGSNYKWYTTGYNSYPYTEKPQNMPNYLYPMLRDHYGDWVMPPQYAYGVAYYEIYADPATAAETTEGETTQPAAKASIKLHMVDLSDSSVTEEGANKKSANYTDTFNIDGIIVKTGYAVFSKSGVNVLSSFAGEKIADLTYTLKLNDSKSVTYDFYKLKTDSAKDGIVSIGATAVSQNKAEVHTWFADAINVTDNTYQVRTPEQLANVAQTAAASFNFNQTHDITVDDFTTVANLNGTYDGKGSTLCVNTQTKTWVTTVDGAVKDLKLELSNGVNAPVFGTINKDKSVTLSGLKIGAVGAEGALANAVSGTMTVPAISTPAVNGMLFGDSDGTINTDAITVGTTDTDGKRIPGAVAQLFGDVANVTVNGAIETGTVSGKLFGDVSGTVSTGAINVTGTAAQVFGDVTGGSLTVTSINTNGNAVSGNVFGNVSAPVTVANGITTVNTSASGTVSGNVFGDINMEAGEAVQVGGITVGNVTNTLVKSITTAAKTDTAAAGSVSLGAVSTQAIGKPAQGETAAKPVDLFGMISGGGTVTTGAITAGDVTGNVFGTVGGTVTTGAINVASLNGKLATTVGGTLQGSAAGTAVNIGKDGTANLTQDLVGTVSGSLKNYAVKAADVSASVVGTLGENGAVTFVSITADSAGNAPVLVKSNGGNIVSCTVEVASVEATDAAAPYGVMADQVKADKKIENSFVKVGTLTIDGNTAQFGALVGTNAGALTGNTVDSNEADKSLALNVTGVNDKEPVIGGLVGTNASTGTVSGGTVDVAITYTQSNTTDDQGNVTATDKGATIGGLVGENSGTIGVADTVTKVKGAVNLTKKNDGQSRAYVIGGAVGNAQSGVTNTTANVKVDAEWAGAPNKEGSATFGSSGITNNGPVGMFVGYAAGVTFTKCESTAANETYQFVGEATFGTPVTIDGLWSSNVKSDKTALNAYSDTDKLSDTSYKAYAGNVTAEMHSGVTTCKSVSTQFNNCTFYLGKEIRGVTYGADQFFYAKSGVDQNAYEIKTPAKITDIKKQNDLSIGITYNGNNIAEYDSERYFKIGEGVYGRAYVSAVKNKTGSVLGTDIYKYTVTMRYMTDANGSSANISKVSDELRYITNRDDTVTIGDGKLYSISVPSVGSGNYLVVDGTNAVNATGTLAVTVGDTFDLRKPMGQYVATYDGNTLTLGGKTYTKTFDSQNAQYYDSDKVLLSFNGLSSNGVTKFQMYPLEVKAGAYQLLTFTYQPNAEYQRQFVTSEKVGEVPAALSEENEIPAEEIGGETGNNT